MRSQWLEILHGVLDKAVVLVEAPRLQIPCKDVQCQKTIAALAGPRFDLLYQRTPDATARGVSGHDEDSQMAMR